MKQSDSGLSKKDLFSHLQSTELFKSLEESVLQEISTDLEHVTISKGEVLFRQGDACDAMYIIIGGQLRVAIFQDDGTEAPTGVVGPGELAGELEILTGGNYTASAHASCDTELVKLPKAAFESLSDKHPEAISQMAVFTIRRMRQNQLATILPKLFGQLDEATLRDTVANIEWVHLKRGERLFRQGDRGDSLYIVISGRLRAVVESGSGTEQVVGEITPPESVGEMALFTGEDRSASIYAIRDSDLVKFSKSEFERLIERYPLALMQITKIIIHRLRKTISSSPMEKAVTNIAVIPAGPDIPLAEFSRRLSDTLSSCIPTLHLGSADLDSLLGTPGMSQIPEDSSSNIRLATWLDDQETKYNFIIYEADMSTSHWTRRCISRADRILIIGQTHADPTPGPIEKASLGLGSDITAAARTLVLLHPDGSRIPSGTEQWLDVRQVEHHHHLRWDTPADFERLARLLTGQAVGLVLGGGGARGYSHIGVISALKEAGIPIDIVGGTSMGAIIASQCAMGADHDAMIQLHKTLNEEDKPFNEYTLPLISLLGSRRLNNAMERLYEGAYIEDLWLNFFCVSTNLSQAEMVIHQKGLLWKAAKASMSLPGIQVPVVENNDLLVDGCVLNNLPGDIMKNLYGGVVIVVNVNPKEDLAFDGSFEQLPSPWEIIWSRINPYKKRIHVPTILNVMMRSSMLSSIHQTNTAATDADYYLEPPVGKYGVLELTAIDEIVEVGYQYAKEKIGEWKKQKAFEKISGFKKS